jgi:hypothetical protein
MFDILAVGEWRMAYLSLRSCVTAIAAVAPPG